jgi:hypothetical protein
LTATAYLLDDFVFADMLKHAFRGLYSGRRSIGSYGATVKLRL